MSENSSDSTALSPEAHTSLPLWRRVLRVAVLPLWVFTGFLLAQLMVVALVRSGAVPASLHPSLLSALLAAVIYTSTLLIVFGVPKVIGGKWPTRMQLGIHRLPRWKDIALTPIGYVGYFVGSLLVLTIAVSLVPGFNINEPQDVGFESLVHTYEYIIAFATLVIIAPLAEELLFRGYLFGKLRQVAPVGVAVLVTSALFGVIHGAWNVGIDTFVLSIVLCLVRVASGSLWPSILLHMAKNGIAFYLLFINPSLTATLGG